MTGPERKSLPHELWLQLNQLPECGWDGWLSGLVASWPCRGQTCAARECVWGDGGGGGQVEGPTAAFSSLTSAPTGLSHGPADSSEAEEKPKRLKFRNHKFQEGSSIWQWQGCKTTDDTASHHGEGTESGGQASLTWEGQEAAPATRPGCLHSAEFWFQWARTETATAAAPHLLGTRDLFRFFQTIFPQMRVAGMVSECFKCMAFIVHFLSILIITSARPQIISIRSGGWGPWLYRSLGQKKTQLSKGAFLKNKCHHDICVWLNYSGFPRKTLLSSCKGQFLGGKSFINIEDWRLLH